MQALPGAPRAHVIQYCNLMVNVLSSAGAALDPSTSADAHILRGLEPAILGEVSRCVGGGGLHMYGGFFLLSGTATPG